MVASVDGEPLSPGTDLGRPLNRPAWRLPWLVGAAVRGESRGVWRGSVPQCKLDGRKVGVLGVVALVFFGACGITA